MTTETCTKPRWHRWALAVVGLASVGIGAVGVFVPGLPTTIFLILASWCFVRSCPELERRFIRDRAIFAPFLRYLQPGARMPLRARIVTLLIMWTAVGLSVASLWVAGAAPLTVTLVIAAAVVGSWFVLRFGRGTAPTEPVAAVRSTARSRASAVPVASS